MRMRISMICNYLNDGLAQDCSKSSALAMEFVQSYTEPSKCPYFHGGVVTPTSQLYCMLLPRLWPCLTAA